MAVVETNLTAARKQTSPATGLDGLIAPTAVIRGYTRLTLVLAGRLCAQQEYNDDDDLRGKLGSMSFWIGSTVGLMIAYFFGSTPTGYLAGKLLRGIDIREHGSKSTGATNVLRTLGKGPALVVLLVDVLKGVAAIVFARWFYPWFSTLPSFTSPTVLDLQTLVPWAVCLSGLAVLLGHGRSIWLNFTGGKSAATGLGVLLAMSLPVGLGAAAMWAVVLAIFRIVSLSSILAALTALALVFSFEQPLPYRLLVIAGGMYVIVRHRDNIQRLLAGAEPRLGQPGSGSKVGQ